MTEWTKQGIFDRVAKHLIAQGRPAMMNQFDCAYRGKGGRSCGIGCLIPDDLYDPEMEKSCIAAMDWLNCEEWTPRNNYPCNRILADILIKLDIPTGYRPLLCDLQRAHDANSSKALEHWVVGVRYRLADVAANHDLDTSVLA